MHSIHSCYLCAFVHPFPFNHLLNNSHCLLILIVYSNAFLISLSTSFCFILVLMWFDSSTLQLVFFYPNIRKHPTVRDSSSAHFYLQGIMSCSRSPIILTREKRWKPDQFQFFSLTFMVRNVAVTSRVTHPFKTGHALETTASSVKLRSMVPNGFTFCDTRDAETRSNIVTLPVVISSGHC